MPFANEMSVICSDSGRMVSKNVRSTMSVFMLTSKDTREGGVLSLVYTFTCLPIITVATNLLPAMSDTSWPVCVMNVELGDTASCLRLFIAFRSLKSNQSVKMVEQTSLWVPAVSVYCCEGLMALEPRVRAVGVKEEAFIDSVKVRTIVPAVKFRS